MATQGDVAACGDIASMGIRIYNTLTRSKQTLVPIIPGVVRMYICGMTVYDYCHLGHARVLVVFDVVARYLRERGFRVHYVRNITDIDDKIIRRAEENNESVGELTERFIGFMNEDCALLDVLRPDQEPRATDYIPQIIAMIEALIERGYAYQADNGDVYYAVSRFTEYGRLSGRRSDELRAGARVEVDEDKRDPLDFALWKAAKPGEPRWNSPWGPGRPGWHIECSAMSIDCLGDHFDIHGGGQDLQFPHHENEIAQSVAATGARFVNIWMHNGFVRVEDEKMSKSLGNFFTVREILKNHHPEEIRYFILASHYRSPLSYSDANLEQARSALTRLYMAMRGLRPSPPHRGDEFVERFHAAMSDDFNTPEAIAVLFDLAREINRLRDSDEAAAMRAAATLRILGGVLGLLQRDPDDYLRARGEASPLADAEIERLLQARADARRRRDWAESDRIRAQLRAAGIAVEDGPSGSVWRRL
jgi:cysteinyl-tRNA synthetase